MADIKHLFEKMHHFGHRLPEKERTEVKQRKTSMDLETYSVGIARGTAGKLNGSHLVKRMSNSRSGLPKRKTIQRVVDEYTMDHYNCSQDNDIRLAVVGAERSGKSALTVRFLTKRFIGEYDSCCDGRFQREIFIADNRIILDVKDTSKMYWIDEPKELINWASAIIVVYSVTSRESFRDAQKILQLIHETKPLEPGCTLLMGNKKDLRHLRQVTKKDGKRLSIHYGVRFSECSAAECYEDLYNTVMRLLLEALVVVKAKQHTNCRSLSLSTENLVGDGSPKPSIKQFMKDTFNSVVLSPRLSRRAVTF
eukprot:gene12701-14005_t